MEKIYSSFDYENYIEEAELYCEDGDKQAIEDMARSMCETDLTEFYIPILEDYFQKHECVVAGYAGRWDGRHNSGIITDSARDFFDLLEDCWYIEIYEDKNCLIVEGTHHDGRNHYEIRELTSKGQEWYRNNGWYWYGKDVINYLFSYNFNSRKPAIEWC